MPELPEVEVVRRGLEACVAGRTVHKMVIREARLRWPVPASLPALIRQRRLTRIDRRSKYLLLDFGVGTLIVHLGMTGNFRLVSKTTPIQAHDHIDLVFDNGVLRYTDPRRFGAMLWHDPASGSLLAHKLLAHLGPEPLQPGFTGEGLFQASRKRKVNIKQFLLSGRGVVGVGNIYASESLFRAGIRPGTAAGRLSRQACLRLADAIRVTLGAAIEQGGTTLRDFQGADGGGGYFQLSCLVYGREGEACTVCRQPVIRSVHQSRATFWCRQCQK
ncbi:MAG: bifunctional DNA-formamidopyrimidine glycosylase/DNA-(apurinic or apyrimidinic site) lyase [Burkholderiaceae bacterium]